MDRPPVFGAFPSPRITGNVRACGHERGLLLRGDAATGRDGHGILMVVNLSDVDEYFAAALIHFCAALGWTHDEFHRRNLQMRYMYVSPAGDP